MSTPQNDTTTTEPERRPGRRRSLLAGLLAVLVLAGGGAWAATRGDDGAAQADSSASADPTTPAAPGSADPGAQPPPSGAGPAAPEVPPAIVEGGEGRPAALVPVALDQPAAHADGVTALLVSIESVEVEGGGVGESSGPALAVTVELTNGTAAPVSLDTVAVNLYRGTDGVPAGPVQHRSGASFGGQLDPGASARAVYVFSVPADQRDVVTVTVLHDPAAGLAVFSGSVA